MSGSDSDLEYESADEDTTEHESSEREIVAEIKNVTEISADLPSNTNNLPTETQEKSDITSKFSDIDVSNDAFNLEKSNQEESNEKYISKENDHKIKIDEAPLPSTPVDIEQFKQESHRIPLRLERKIQQKCQAKESANDTPKTDNLVQEKSPTKETSSVETVVNKEKSSSSWGFSSWGTSLLSTAASSVTSFSSQVSQGIGTVLETVESSLGAPSPEELASTLKEKKEKEQENCANVENENTEFEGGLGILPDVSAWTKVLETTGSKVIMGGLDTLELIGKKTMDILTEGDPRLMNKRHVFSENVNLSQMLREAKEKAEKETENNGMESMDIVNYSQVFDDHQGLVHLEALEMLSKQTQATFQRLFMRHSKKIEIKKRLDEIKSICENIPSVDDVSEVQKFEDFESVFKKHSLELNLPLNINGVVNTQKKLNENVLKYENIEEPYPSPDEIFTSSITSLAEFTAKCIETFHKIAELILVQKNLGPTIEQCATNLTGMTTVMCIDINNLSTSYHKCLDSSSEHFPDYINYQGLNVTAMVTNLYVEASNSNKYIQDAFQMLVPVLQVCLLESIEE